MLRSGPPRSGAGARYCVLPATVLVAASLAVPSAVRAQYTETAYFETWTDLATIYELSERFRYDGDYGIRAVVSTPDFSQIFLRPSVRYAAADWLRLHGGLGWFHTFFPNDSDVDELRPWAGARFGPRRVSAAAAATE